MTIDDLLNAWCRSMRRQGLAPSTIDKRRRCLADILYDLGASPSRAEVEEWLDDRDLSAKSRATWLSHLGAFWGWAIEEGYAAANPVRGIKAPKTPRRLPRPLNDVELSDLMASAPSPRLRAMVALAALGGLRCCEIANLTRADVMTDRQLLRVLGKGDRERLVPMHPGVALALAAHGLPERGPVFATEEVGHQGHPMSANAVSHVLGSHLHARGIVGGAHRLRHSFATNIYAATRDLRVTQELMGHASPTTTAVYTAVADEGARAAVGALMIA